MSFLYMIFAGRHITCMPSHRVQGIAACLGLLVSKPNNDLYRPLLQMVQPRKLTWLAGTSTIWRCISYWKWGFSNVDVTFQGCNLYLGCAYRDEQSWAAWMYIFATKWRGSEQQGGGFEHQPYSNVSKHGKTIENWSMFHPGKLSKITILNPKMKVRFRWFSWSIGWLLGSVLIFQKLIRGKFSATSVKPSLL